MADKTLHVISICGSLRKGSYNRMVMSLLPGYAPAGKLSVTGSVFFGGVRAPRYRFKSSAGSHGQPGSPWSPKASDRNVSCSPETRSTYSRRPAASA